MLKITDEIKAVAGIGDAKVKKFNKKKVYTIEDLIRFYPRNYIKHEEFATTIDDAIKTGKPIKAVVANKPKVDRSSGKCITKVTMRDCNGAMFLSTWFNLTGASLGIKEGDIVVLEGKCQVKDDFKFITHPNLYHINEYEKLMNKPDAVYSLTEGLSSAVIKKHVLNALEHCEVEHTLPQSIVDKYNMPPLKDILIMIHDPEDYDELNKANQYLAYEELFNFMFKLKKEHAKNNQIKNTFSFTNSIFTQKALSVLEFELTQGQKDALNNIYSDLSSPNITSRLIQGDVSCGKTLIAIMSLIHALENNHQATLIAPTEVLATQHYNEFEKINKEAGMGLNLRLLTASTPKKEKDRIANELENGFPIAVIGTHSVINKSDSFTDLAVAVVDEQHKFGVNQRDELVKSNPHVITMTATPIPRSLSLTIYGNDAVSEIRQLPGNRKPIKNCTISEKKLNDALAFIEREVEQKHQAYIVCPAIEDADGIDIYSVDKITEIMQNAYPNVKVAKVSGKTKKAEKEQIMADYKAGNIDVLISTTVIEVGINVPNATTMMIMNAERFGLATLHQLRGRVGRGNLQSYCIFIDCLESEDSKSRMQTITSTNSGFEIAEADLVMRGPGELLGTEQSGMWDFKKADITNQKMLKAVLVDVNDVLSKQYWKKKIFWSDGYFACSIGEVSSATIQKYIESQG